MADDDVTPATGVPLRAPFPYFGGKSRAASLVWEALGDVRNYVEPFFGSGAVLLSRPTAPGIETVNDAEGMICNFWRAVQADPDAVAHHADWPVNALDMHARQRWLMGERDAITARLREDPAWCDVKVAGWWCWGQCVAIPGNWMVSKGLGAMPHVTGCSAGTGVRRTTMTPREMMLALRDRMRRVRVLCGNFDMALAPAVVLGGLGATSPAGVFLDPPYSHAERDRACYGATDDATASDRARAWALANGDHPRMRIVLAGYEGEHAMPPTWRCVAWRAHGGMGHSADGRGKSNRMRERLWCSPHCLTARQPGLFDARAGGAA